MQPSEIQAVKQRFGIIGNSELLNRAIDVAVQVAPTDLSVLITGESGVGKENFPQIIHYYSHRKHGPYIAVNCGAIPEGTIDSELFGHEKGSFTGAMADRKGYFEVADGGTIFLDEVGELPLSTQVRLLRVLETGEFIKVGSSKIQKTNVRVIAATNLNMTQAVRDGRFREDLYYRLNTVPIYVPPLRERKEDIVLLFRKFAADFAEKYHMPPIKLTEDAKKLLTEYYWNGNVRQLKNITEQISVIEQQREITAEILKQYLPKDELERFPVLLSNHRSDQKTFTSEREILYQVLFDMKQDMIELKKLVYNLMNAQGNQELLQKDFPLSPSYVAPHETFVPATPVPVDVLKPVNNLGREVNQFPNTNKQNSFEEAAEFQEIEDIQEPMTLEDMERQMIKKTLEKHKGKRKAAAEELKISERTLYRKIKEYGIE
ncbi:MAG TPA: sigma-54 dependent transcriptional regulator [Paludibacteraceae bacterium]|nr:sigma-54 dependent transcriptional regulator [Paludibacteraceae bacterium]HOL28744.1 sigma-54 dependent transcriptional regulator [Paludibacteraceae bacterium]HON01749.1 sigma-54 dependent transcriptional regulator [Paludibacteraceae bacterium]HPD58535.1 sigma-54 dependent transcriptional regulator [Paludibacteraceae bacterium]HPQ12080.1 sigma-54 dependent transcriptional regulator [Paludibacteraceae bacterium]